VKNDRIIAAALGLAAERAGSNAELGRQVGIHGATIGKYRNGIISQIDDDSWELLYPALRPFLPPGAKYMPRSRLDSPSQVREITIHDYAAGESVRPVDVRPVPVYGLSQAQGMSGDVWGDVPPDAEEGLDIMYTADPHVVAGFRVAGQSMEQRGIHDGDIVACRRVESPTDVPPDCVVVAKIDDEVYVKRYRRVGDTVLLLSAGADGRDLEVHASDIQWLLRAVEVVHKL